MKERCFAFGCSYTSHDWPTVADFVGINFNQYYNLGISGSSNTFIVDQIIKANDIYNFNNTDLILIGTTGFGRFSIYNKDKKEWNHSGDIFPLKHYHDRLQQLWAKEFDSVYFSSYRSLLALKTIKVILNSLNVLHIVYGAVSNINFQYQNNETNSLLNQFYDLHSIKDDIDNFTITTMPAGEMLGYTFEDGTTDRHPSIKQHYNYFKKYFPDFVNQSSEKFFNYCEQNFQFDTLRSQQNWYSSYKVQLKNFINDTKLKNL